MKGNTFNQLGNEKYAKGQFQKAAQNYRKAINEEPKNAIYHNNLSYAYKNQAKYIQAELQMLKAIQLDPKNPNWRNSLALIYYSMGDYNKMEQNIHKELEKKPTIFRQIRYQMNLSFCYLLQGKLKMAFTNASNAILKLDGLKIKMYKIEHIENYSPILFSYITQSGILFDHLNKKLQSLHQKFKSDKLFVDQLDKKMSVAYQPLLDFFYTVVLTTARFGNFNNGTKTYESLRVCIIQQINKKLGQIQIEITQKSQNPQIKNENACASNANQNAKEQLQAIEKIFRKFFQKQQTLIGKLHDKIKLSEYVDITLNKLNMQTKSMLRRKVQSDASQGEKTKIHQQNQFLESQARTRLSKVQKHINLKRGEAANRSGSQHTLKNKIKLENEDDLMNYIEELILENQKIKNDLQEKESDLKSSNKAFMQAHRAFIEKEKAFNNYKSMIRKQAAQSVNFSQVGQEQRMKEDFDQECQ